jgi:hypothetical protein
MTFTTVDDAGRSNRGDFGASDGGFSAFLLPTSQSVIHPPRLPSVASLPTPSHVDRPFASLILLGARSRTAGAVVGVRGRRASSESDSVSEDSSEAMRPRGSDVCSGEIALRLKRDASGRKFGMTDDVVLLADAVGDCLP